MLDLVREQEWRCALEIEVVLGPVQVRRDLALHGRVGVHGWCSLTLLPRGLDKREVLVECPLPLHLEEVVLADNPVEVDPWVGERACFSVEEYEWFCHCG